MLDRYATRVDTAVKTDHPILAGSEVAILQFICEQVRTRSVVHHEWGISETGDSGVPIGTAILFASGDATKSLAGATLVAKELGLAPYRVDLSRVVSKYLGETEKNLRRLFDAAEEAGAVLLFDEADALFGKRSEVKDSHDRYANISTHVVSEMIYAFRGIVIISSSRGGEVAPELLRSACFVLRLGERGTAQ